MIIKWLGHSCFKIINGNESLVIDPFADGSVAGLNNIREEANIVLCSHLHKDHCAVECVKLIESKENLFSLDSFETYHDDKQGKLRGNNVVNIISSDGYKIVHLGDLGCQLTEEEITKIYGCDVLLIPVGGYFTIDGKLAADIVDKVQPRIAIPMHYRGDNFGYDVLDTVFAFAKYFDNVVYLTTNTLELSDELNDEIIVLDYIG